MIRLTNEGLWKKREIVYEMSGSERAHPKLVVVFGILELYGSSP